MVHHIELWYGLDNKVGPMHYTMNSNHVKHMEVSQMHQNICHCFLEGCNPTGTKSDHLLSDLFGD